MLDDYDNQHEFVDDVAGIFPVQSNDPACTSLGCNISSCCNVLLNNAYGPDPLSRLAALTAIVYENSCLDPDHQATLADLSDTSLNGVDRIWLYQTCAEFAFYQTCDPDSQCIFTKDPHFDTLQSNYDLCKFAFNIDGSQTEKRVDFSNLYYGSDQTASSRILFVNGQIDPWHALSVLQSLSAQEPALWVEGASHHAWTHPPQPTDSPQIVAVRQEIMDQVNSWLLDE